MAASFPGSIKTWTPVVDNVDEILAVHVNDAYEEIIAIETATQEVFANVAKNANDIKQIENTITQMNPTGDAKVPIVAYDTVNSLPKNAAQAGLSVIQGGMTAQNMIDGDFSATGDWTYQFATFTVAAGVGSVLASALNGALNQSIPNFAQYRGHKIYFMASIKIDATSVNLYLNDGTAQVGVPHSINNVFERLSGIMDINIAATTLFIKLQDQRTSGWTEIQIKDARAIDLTAIAQQALTLSQADAMLLNYFSGTKSAVTGRVKSVGKNRCPYDISAGNVKYGFPIFSTDGIYQYMECNAVGDMVKKGYRIPTEPSAPLSVSCIVKKVSGAGSSKLYLVFQDINKVSISGQSFDVTTNSSTDVTLSITNKIAPSNAYYVLVVLEAGALTKIAFKNLQLELGTTVTAYEAFKSTEQYCLPLPLYRVPNGVRDTVENGKHIQRVKEFTLQASDISINTLFANIDRIFIPKPVDATSYNNTSSGFGSVTLNGYTQISIPLSDNASEVGNFAANHSNTSYLLAVTKGTTLAQAQTTLTGEKVIYQLATPIVTDNVLSGTLLGYPSGTVYYEPVIADIAVYDTSLAIFNTAYPIASLESLYKIDMTTGEQLELDPTTAVIASGGLSFTHASLAAADLVGFTYFFAHAYPYGENTYTYFDNNIVVIDTVTAKTYKYRPVVTSGAIASWALTEVV